MALTFDRSLDAAPGVPVRLSPHVERVLAPNPGPFTFCGTGVYLVGDDAEVAVIDPGPDLPEHVAALKRAIGARALRAILVTHTHRDHSPASRPLKAWSGAPIFAAAAAPPPAREEGYVDEAHDHDFVPDHLLHDGETVRAAGLTFTAIATPGHTANHLCYALREEAALFCGDHVMGWATSVIAPPDGDMAAYVASLEKLAGRGDRILYPTHGAPISEPAAWLAALIAHRRARARQVEQAVAQGAETVAAIVARLYPDLAPGLSGAAAAQVAAHLVQLLDEKRLTRDGVRYRLYP